VKLWVATSDRVLEAFVFLGCLHSIVWWLVTNILKQPFGPFCNGQVVQEKYQKQWMM